MRFTLFRHWSVVCSLGLATALAASNASAKECSDSSECPKGFTCEVSESESCADLPPCAPDEECEPTATDCTTQEFSACVSIDCSSNSDCAEGMACETIETRHCTTAACAPGQECPDVDTGCEPETRNYCVPRYLLPCTAAADCGAGFSCVEREACSCSGSSGSEGGPDGGGEDGFAPAEDPTPGGGADGAEAPVPVPEDTCSCEPSGEFACQMDVTECDAEADCTAGFSCSDNPEATVCSSSSNGDAACPEPEFSKVCLPPYLDLFEGGGYAGGSLQETDGAANPGSGSNGEQAGNADDDSAVDTAADAKAKSGGCALSQSVHSRHPLSVLLLALLGGAWLTRRRTALMR